MLKVNDTALILVDYQGKLARVMHETEELHANMVRLIKGAQLLSMPIIWLEQYPQGLGPTSDDIKQLLEEKQNPIAKMTFSACENSEFQTQMEQLRVENFIIAGIEAHICVYQTVRELLRGGKYVEYVQDATSSRTLNNKLTALKKMNLLGAVPTSVEMVLFELMGTAEHPNFKDISKLIK